MSGYGYSGGRTRCFMFWQEFSKVGDTVSTALTSQCYAGADEPSQCIAQKEDYMECLHKTKEIERAQEIKKTFV
ncbi:hypothetical protein A1Q1_01936 [Trichosporon asahii var. asahii CBS 2479]|nr:hypothetical protein A1Q1_01936 [Trichosporon asahii var. asahii CBS 2479]EJT49025.1 hypothetical protein A1Q1_01936 [Trichosporon asahii var. asahii CBS 2479]